MPTRPVPPANLPAANLSAVVVALRVIAGLMLLGAAYLFSGLLVPFLLALVLAIVLSPIAGWLERHGAHRVVSSLACTLSFALVLLLVGGMLLYQAGTIVQDADRYFNELGSILARTTRASGADEYLEKAGITAATVQEEARAGDSEDGGLRGALVKQGDPEPDDQSPLVGSGGEDESPQSAGFWIEHLRGTLGVIGQWIVGRIGGVIGFFAGVIITLAGLFYMLMTRQEWVERITASGRQLGLRPDAEGLEEIRGQITTFLGGLGLIACGYVVFITLSLWALGVPQPPLWGILTGMLQFIPIIGPLTAGVLTTLASLVTGEIWKTLVVIGLYLTLATFEGYVVWPYLFGRSIHFNQVTILFGILFFGWLLGPFGPILALPVMIILREIVLISPDTPALETLMTPQEDDEDESGNRSRGGSPASHRRQAE